MWKDHVEQEKYQTSSMTIVFFYNVMHFLSLVWVDGFSFICGEETLKVFENSNPALHQSITSFLA
jgi:hypothetical protein